MTDTTTPQTGAPTTGAPVVHIDGDEPTLRGEIAFRIPSLYDQIAIERRMVELVNAGVPPGAPMVRMESLPTYGQYLVQAVATLEHVITRAPEGFYETKAAQDGPVLAVGRLATVDQDVLRVAYEGFLAYRKRFRDGRRGHDDTPEGKPNREAGDDRGPENESGSEGGTGDS